MPASPYHKCKYIFHICVYNVYDYNTHIFISLSICTLTYAYIHTFYLIPNWICGDCIYERRSLQVNYKFLVCCFGIINNNSDNNSFYSVFNMYQTLYYGFSIHYLIQSLQQSGQEGIIAPLLQMNKLWLREFNELPLHSKTTMCKI